MKAPPTAADRQILVDGSWFSMVVLFLLVVFDMSLWWDRRRNGEISKFQILFFKEGVCPSTSKSYKNSKFCFAFLLIT